MKRHIYAQADAHHYSLDGVDNLLAALRRAHEQLLKYDAKGPKQVTRAVLTIEQALGLGEKPQQQEGSGA